MNSNEIELVLTKTYAYPINGRELFEVLKSLGECKAMFNGFDTCFYGDFFVGSFPFSEKSQGIIDYSSGNVYFEGCQRLWINPVKIFKHSAGKFENINIHILRLFATQGDYFTNDEGIYTEISERHDKIVFSLIIQNENVPLKHLKNLIPCIEHDNDLFTLFVDAMLKRAIDNSEELKMIGDVNGLKRKILARLVGCK